jgi:hypothetical protein
LDLFKDISAMNWLLFSSNEPERIRIQTQKTQHLKETKAHRNTTSFAFVTINRTKQILQFPLAFWLGGGTTKGRGPETAVPKHVEMTKGRGPETTLPTDGSSLSFLILKKNTKNI